jgi:hypothetical protein
MDALEVEPNAPRLSACAALPLQITTPKSAISTKPPARCVTLPVLAAGAVAWLPAHPCLALASLSRAARADGADPSGCLFLIANRGSSSKTEDCKAVEFG